jgi:hypothetical protein
MQDTKIAEPQCHYPDCPSAAVKICRTCHQSFCARHIHRRWWSYIREFCLQLKAAERAAERPYETYGPERHAVIVDEVREKDEQEQIAELDNEERGCDTSAYLIKSQWSNH